MALLDNDTQINTIMPNYVKDHLLEMGPITDLVGTRVTCIGLGNAYTCPLGYIIVQVQVNGVQSYDEDQIALVVLDECKFAKQVPIILGTPTISHIMNVMKEREIDALAMPGWNICYLCVGLQPHCWKTKPWKVLIQMGMMKWSSWEMQRL